MTCSEWDDLIADLADQISDKETLIVGATPSCISDDVWSGTHPSAPFTTASVAARISELQMIYMMALPAVKPFVLNSIASYQAIQQMLFDKQSLINQRGMAIQQKQMEGCS